MPIDSSWYERLPDLPDRTSAGGVVVRRVGDELLVALVREAGKPAFVLPKGGVEVGESLEQAARREIHEEAGFSQLSFLGELGSKERLTFDRHAWVSQHFFLFSTDEVDVQPTEAGYSPPEWFAIEALPEMFSPEQKALLTEQREKINRLALG